MLHQCGQDQMSFHEREVVADVDARPIPERQIGVMGQALLRPWREALGDEASGGGKGIGSPMQRIRADHDNASSGQVIASNLDRTCGLSSNDIGGRVEAHCLLEDLECVGQVWKVSDGRRAFTQDTVDLITHLRVHLWVLREQGPRPGQRVGGGLMACQDQCHHLVT